MMTEERRYVRDVSPRGPMVIVKAAEEQTAIPTVDVAVDSKAPLARGKRRVLAVDGPPSNGDTDSPEKAD